MADSDAIQVAESRRIHNLNIIKARYDPCLSYLEMLSRSVGVLVNKSSWTVSSKVPQKLCKSLRTILDDHGSIAPYTDGGNDVGWLLKLPGDLVGGGRAVTVKGYEMYGGSYGAEPDTTLVRMLQPFLPAHACTSIAPLLHPHSLYNFVLQLHCFFLFSLHGFYI